MKKLINFFLKWILPFRAKAILATIIAAIFAAHTSVAQTCVTPPSGIVSWWPAEGNALDNAGTNNGTLQTNVTYAPGEDGQGFDFNGSSSYIVIGNPASLQLQNFTIEAWVRRTSSFAISLVAPNADFFAYGSGGYGLGMFNDGSLYLTKSGVDSVQVSTGLTDTNNFHHVAVTKSGTDVVFYLDGNSVGSMNYNELFTFAGSASIGAEGVDEQSPFYGVIDELAIYGRALAPIEIQAIYNAGSSGKCPLSPAIYAEPTNQAVFSGKDATFSVAATGMQPLNYQWSFNGTNIMGATNSTLTLTNVLPSQAGTYYVVVNNFVTNTPSTNVTLTVNIPPCVNAPSNIVSWWTAEGNALDNVNTNNGMVVNEVKYGPGEDGQAFIFNGSSSYIAIGNPANLQLQDFTIEAWIRRSSSSSASLAAGNADLFAYGNGGYGFGIYNDGSLYLTRAGVSSVQAASGLTDTNNFHHVAVTKSGTSVIFYLDGTSVGTLDYDDIFTFGGVVSIGAEGGDEQAPFYGAIDELAVYSRALVPAEIQAIYNAGSGGKCDSFPPTIYAQPTNETVILGKNTTFSIGAIGSQPLSYQWNFNGTNILGATNFSLTLTNVQFSQAGIYYVVVSNAVNPLASTNVTLAVVPPPPCVTAPADIVSWWPAEGNALDIANTNDGVVENDVAYGPGEDGQAFVFNGGDSYINIGNPTSLQLQDFTIEAWILRSSSSIVSQVANNADLLAYGSGGYGFGMLNDGSLYLTKSGVDSVTVSTGLADTNNFHHAAVTKSGSTVIFYLDGASVGMVSYGSVFTFGSSVSIGAQGGNEQAPFYGAIDELAIYSRALSSNEILSIYNAGSGGKCDALPPAIYASPTNESLMIGKNAAFSVGAAGSQPLSYQWSFDGTNILGATNFSLILTNVQFSQAGIYSVVVSNMVNPPASTNLTLTVNPPPPCVPPPTNLVSWWPAEGNAMDLLGGNSGIQENNISYGPGEDGQAFVFNGSSSYITIGNPPNLQLQDFTIEAWIQRSSSSVVSLTSGNADLFAYGSGGYGFGIDNDGSLYLTKSGVDSVQAGTGLTDTTNFHHVAVTKSGSSVVFYLDGSPVGTAGYGDVFTFGGTISIGAQGDNEQAPFYGAIDELTVYSRALAPSEILSIYEAGSRGKCVPGPSPSIYTQPASQNVLAGSMVTFSANVTGSAPLSFQWKLNTTNIPGATNESLTLINVQPSDAGNYSLLVTNAVNSITTSNALLEVGLVTVYGDDEPLTNDEYVFTNSVAIQFVNVEAGGFIFYTLDGTIPTAGSTFYSGPFIVTNNSIIQTLGFSPNFLESVVSDPVVINITNQFILTATTAGGGTIAVNPAESVYPSNTLVNVTALASNGWSFLQWQGDLGGTSLSNTVLMSRSKTVQAVFGTTVTNTVGGNGSVVFNPLGGIYPFGMVLQATALPQPGNVFVLWSDAATGGGSTNPLNFSVTNADPTISALFGTLGKGHAALAVVPSGEGTVSLNPAAANYTIGQSVVITATPRAGNAFLGWSGAASGSTNPLTVILNQSETIYANFSTNFNLSFRLGPGSGTSEGVEIDLSGELGSQYRVDGSTDLINWTPLFNLTNSVGTLHFVDTNAEHLNFRFYRAVLLP
jgi:hypothetical protein